MERSPGWTVLLPQPRGEKTAQRATLQGEYRNGGKRYYDRVQAALEKSHGDGMAQCLCVDRPDENRVPALPIRKLPSDELILVLNKNSGHFHDSHCYWFREDLRNSGAQTYVDGVIVEDGDAFKLRLKTSLKPRGKKKPGDPLEAPADRDRSPGKTQRAMTQRGLLNFLWDFSGMNVWRPAFASHREPNAAFQRLRASTKNVFIAKQELRRQLALCFQPSEWREPYRKWAYHRERGLVLAIVTGINADMSIDVLYHAENALILQGNEIIRRHLETSFARELALLKNEHATVVGLFTCDFEYAGPNVRGSIVDAALLATHAGSLIPVESSYELTFTSYLIDNAREFRKPMRYDADDDVVFPDFLLEDAVRRELPIEVWGRNDAPYLRRKAEKIAYFNANAPGWISWDAVAGEPLPQLPPRRIKKAG